MGDLLETRAFEALVAEAAAQLVSVRHDVSGSFVTTPLMYPSGGAVVVWIDRLPPYFRVSDYSLGARECEIMGADRRQFHHHAEPVAEATGVELGKDGTFQVFVSEGQLQGAIKAIASASQEVAQKFANRVQRRQLADVKQVLMHRLQRHFGKHAVDRDIEFQGASTTAWQIDARVTRGDHIALFETVTPWFPSVASTLAKFGDIRLLEDAPARNAVLSQKEGFGSWLTALSQNGNVIQASAEDTVYERAARLV
ncbi:MAG: hypothetical protein ACM3ZV_02810 [Bacillota bacterium]